MAAQQLSARVLAERAEIEMWQIRSGKFTESEWEKFVLTMQELSTVPLYIDDTGGISIAQIAAGTGKSPKAVESLLSRAREQFRASLRWYFSDTKCRNEP